jgi:hypothetical protein
MWTRRAGTAATSIIFEMTARPMVDSWANGGDQSHEDRSHWEQCRPP